VFTNNLDTANTLTRALKVGSVWVNCFDIFDATIPFGGYKMSGMGREKGIDSLKNYLQIKAVVTPLKNPAWLWTAHTWSSSEYRLWRNVPMDTLEGCENGNNQMRWLWRQRTTLINSFVLDWVVKISPISPDVVDANPV
jgi:hypothetical protein